MFRNTDRLTAAVLALLAIVACGCSRQVQRYGSVIGIPKENIPEYARLHCDLWPGVLKQIKTGNIDNYSIYLGEFEKDSFYLFSYFEYTGDNFDADMAKMADDKMTQDWWSHVKPLQKPLSTRQAGEHWAEWEEVFHHDGPAYDNTDVTSRHGSIIGIDEKNILAYTQMHATAWPGVLASIERCNIRNYSIYLGQVRPGENLLFSYFEYIGDDFGADMEKIGDKVTKTWWTYTDPLQRPLPTRKKGEHWASMEEVFHTD